MKRETWIIFGLVAITLLAFSGVGRCGFVNFDDPEYVFNNPHVTSGLSAGNFLWAWTTFYQGNYLPLTWLSLMLDVTVLGHGPHTFHWMNVAFHIANAVLVYLFFRMATGAVWRSAVVAAVFAVHPLRVESVVWVVERKDVLTGFFGILTMLAYLRYARKLKWTGYAAVLLLFGLTLLAKQVLVTLPCVLLLLDYWPLGRWDRGPVSLTPSPLPRRSGWQLIREKLPLLVMGAAILTVTIKAQSQSAMSDLKAVPLGWRLANVPVSYARYLGKMVWFSNLAVLYPRHPWNIAQIACSSLLLMAITVICVKKLRSSPWLIVGWLWFLGVLIPMIGLVQCGPQAMADRFTYFSGIGLVLMLAWSIPSPTSDKPMLLRSLVGMAIILFMLFTIVQTRYWRTSEVLFEHDIAVAGSSSIAEANLGSALTDRNDLSDAITHLKKAQRLNPRDGQTQCGLALALEYNHQTDDALRYGLSAVQLVPKSVMCHVTLAYILRKHKRFKESAEEARAAIALDPLSSDAHDNLGAALFEMGQTDEGMRQLELALSIKPDSNAVQVHLARYRAAKNERH